MLFSPDPYKEQKSAPVAYINSFLFLHNTL